MIGKVANAGAGFKGLLDYLLHGAKGSQPDTSRVGFVVARNLLVDEPMLMGKLMQVTAARSLRCRAPAYHFIVSWRASEAPSDETMLAVADATCGDLGVDAYQRVYVGHHDRAHRHVHVLLNRVHPETGKAWNRRNDFVRIEQSLARQSEDVGFAVVRGRHNAKRPRREGAVISSLLAGTSLTTSAQRALAFDELAAAKERADIALALHTLGLATRRNVKTAIEDRARARTAIHETSSFRQRLTAELLQETPDRRPPGDRLRNSERARRSGRSRT